MHRIMTTTQTPGLWETAAPSAHDRIAQLERELAEARARLTEAIDGQHGNSALVERLIVAAWAEALGLSPDVGWAVEDLQEATRLAVAR